MMRKLTVCACALVGLLLLSDASAQGCHPVYGGSGYAASYGGYGYGRYGYRYASRYGGYGYNPGGLGGPYSGLGVRPGLGFGGFGLRR